MGLGRFSLFCLEPSLLHFLQEILGDREAGGITYYGVGMAEGAFGCRRLIREVIRDFGWREDFAAEEAAALFRLLYLFLVAEAAIVSLAEDSVLLRHTLFPKDIPGCSASVPWLTPSVSGNHPFQGIHLVFDREVQAHLYNFLILQGKGLGIMLVIDLV